MQPTDSQPGLVGLIDRYEHELTSSEDLSLFGFSTELAGLDTFNYDSASRASITEIMHEREFNQNSRNRVYRHAIRREAVNAVPDRTAGGHIFSLMEIMLLGDNYAENSISPEAQRKQIVSALAGTVPQNSLNSYLESMSLRYEDILKSIERNRKSEKGVWEKISGEDHYPVFLREKNLFDRFKIDAANLYHKP
ncbi:MAG: hypothetical protein AABX00_06800 [Nanoarchaeota archaeon]